MRKVRVFSREFISGCTIGATAGTTGAMGGDSGHGGRTVIEFYDAGGADISGELIERAGGSGVRIVLGGDMEMDLIAQALEWAAATIRREAEAARDKNWIHEIP